MALPGKDVHGVIVAETIGRSWFEYTQENLRRQDALLGEPMDQVDVDVRAHVQCSYHFYLQHESSDEVAKLGSTCKDMLASNAGMSDFGWIENRCGRNTHFWNACRNATDATPK